MVLNNKKILILVNRVTTLFNFRIELVEKLIDEGYEIVVSMPYHEKAEILKKKGCKYEDVNIERHGTNPVKDLSLLKYYKKIIKKHKPNIILSYTVKPNIYGAIAARKLNIPIIANITGLGIAIMNKGLTQSILKRMYKYSFKSVYKVFFQNEGNKNYFINNIYKLNNYEVLPGSGVNLKKFSFEVYPRASKILNFLYVGKLMKDKGIDYLLEAIKQIKVRNNKCTFTLVGRFEENYEEKISSAVQDKLIIYKPETENIQELYKNCHAIIHPTFHEGMSNILQEAAATGRPLLASNINGCKEIIDEGKNGLLFEPKNSESIVNAIEKFIKLSYKEKIEMGVYSRKKVEREFDRNIVVSKYIQTIKEIKNV